MSYPVPTLDEMTSFLVAFWHALFPRSNVTSRFAYHWKRLRAYSGGVTDLHAHVVSAQGDVMPDSAQGSYLTRWGKIVGVAKKDATPARGTKALRCYGVPGAVVSIGDQLVEEATGNTFQATSLGTVPGGGTYVDVDIAGISTGSATRISAGTTLRFVAPGAGIQTNATTVLALDSDGFDIEQDGAYSVRVNDELSKPRMGGSQDDFVKWALQVTGVATAKCYPNRAGVGTVDVVGFYAANGSARALTAPDRAALLAYLKTQAPSQLAGAGGALRVLETLPDAQNIEITLQPNGDPAYAFDWDDSAAPVVLAWTALTRTLQFAADIPGTLIAGKRFVMRGVASAQDGAIFTVEAVTASDTIIVRETPTVAPVATDVVYAAGPLTQPIRDAVIAHMNGETVFADAGKPIAASVAGSRVGLRVLADGISAANPAGIYGPWSGAIIRAQLAALAAYATGVRNVNVITPANDYEAADPPFPGDAQIYFVAPGRVLVRKG